MREGQVNKSKRRKEETLQLILFSYLAKLHEQVSMGGQINGTMLWITDRGITNFGSFFRTMQVQSVGFTAF